MGRPPTLASGPSPRPGIRAVTSIHLLSTLPRFNLFLESSLGALQMDSLNSRTEQDIPFFVPKPTAARPLAGLTILAVEDSRFASEALRLMSLRSGARIRRADCLASAHRHLNTYRPTVAIVDLGLPDGSGLTLIEEMQSAQPRVPIIFGTSGADRDEAERNALAAGADGFFPKPVDSLARFQTEILSHLPDAMLPKGPRAVDGSKVAPDRLALREDLVLALKLLGQEVPPTRYLSKFLLGIGRSSGDRNLIEAARGLPETLAKHDRRKMLALLKERVLKVAPV